MSRSTTVVLVRSMTGEGDGVGLDTISSLADACCIFDVSVIVDLELDLVTFDDGKVIFSGGFGLNLYRGDGRDIALKPYVTDLGK